MPLIKKEMIQKFKQAPRRTKIFILAGAVLMILLIFKVAILPNPLFQRFVLGRKPAAKKIAEELGERAVTVRTYKTARTHFVDLIPVMGTIRAHQKVDMRFQTNGKIETIAFREGEVARSGEVLARLDQRDAGLKLDFAKSKLKTQTIESQAIEKKLQMHRHLYDIGAIIKTKLEEVELEYKNSLSKVESSEHEVKFAEAELDKTNLYASMDGVLGTRDAEEGEYVTTTTKIGTFVGIEDIFVEVGVIEKDIDNIRLGQAAKFRVDTYPSKDFEGTVEYISPVLEGKSRTATAKIKTQNPQYLLLPGMFARTEIKVFEKDQALMVPGTAMYDLDGDGGFDSVYAVDEESKARVKPIKMGYVTSDYVEILEGLDEGADVVVEARGELKEGIAVEVTEAQEAVPEEEETGIKGLKK